MSVTRSLTFLWTPWTVAISALAVLTTAAFCFIAWRRSGYRSSMGLLELLRLVLVAMVAVMLNQPEWIEEYRPEEKPTIAVLWDASPSMETRDVVRADQPTTSATTRREAAAPLADPVVLGPASSPDEHRHPAVLGIIRRARIPRALRRLTEAANVVRTCTTRSPRRPSGSPTCAGSCWPPTATGTRASRRSRPPPGCGSRACRSSPCPLGSRTRLPDVELLSLDVPTFGVAGKSVRVPFTIDSSLPREYLTTVTLKSSDGDQVTKDVRIAPMSRTTDWLRLEAEGDRRLHPDAHDPQARRRDLGREQHALGPDRDPRGEAPRAAGRVVPALGVPLPEECPVARPRASSSRACCSTRA